VDRQERWRDRYADLRPGWVPSTDIYASLIADRVDPETRARLERLRRGEG